MKSYSDCLEIIKERYGVEVAGAVAANCAEGDVDAIYKTLQSVVIERFKPQMESFNALRSQHCNSAVLREEREVTDEDIAALETATRKFRVS